jgi:hypothetical protein
MSPVNKYVKFVNTLSPDVIVPSGFSSVDKATGEPMMVAAGHVAFHASVPPINDKQQIATKLLRSWRNMIAIPSVDMLSII